MKVPFNTLKPGYRMYRDEYLRAATRVLDSGWYVLGEEVTAFEEEFAHRAHSPHCVGVNSGLDALTLTFRALGLGAGDEVIVPGNTYIASVLGVTENGATPVFVEPDRYHCIDASLIEAAITGRTKAVLAVHLYGQVCHMSPISDICCRHNIALVEDCAQSHGATDGGQMCGTFGTAGCYSFFPTKNLGAFGDAGAIVTADGELARILRSLRNYGSGKKYHNETAGVNSRLDELQAALLRVKLTHMDELTAARRKIAARYLEGIKNPRVALPLTRDGSAHVYHLFVVSAENEQARDALAAHLARLDIGTQVHYPVPPHKSGAYHHMNGLLLPVTEDLVGRILSLPIYDGMTAEEAGYVIDGVNSWGG